jgi:hypothetical protein
MVSLSFPISFKRPLCYQIGDCTHHKEKLTIMHELYEMASWPQRMH